MAFGIGVNTEHPQQEQLTGELRDVAVKCWFTSEGKSMPLMFKVKTEEGEVIAVEHVEVLTVDKQWYAGILNIKYRCQAAYQGRLREFVLLFCPEECEWKIIV